jgi:hypothetical protein
LIEWSDVSFPASEIWSVDTPQPEEYY